LQAYVQRFLRLRAQTPIVPNELVIEAMIKGLRLGPTTQYFARKPPQTLEKLLQKMAEYIRVDNDFRQRREEAIDTLKWPGASEEDSTLGMSGQSIMPAQVTTGETKPKGNSTAPNHQGHNKVPSGHQLQEEEGAETSEEDMEISPESFFVCSAAKTNGIPEERARLRSKSRKRLPKHDRISRSRFYIPLCAILHMSQSM
jgi:hypothetical protein